MFQSEFLKTPMFTKHSFWFPDLIISIIKLYQAGNYLYMQGNFHWWVKGIKTVLIGYIVLKYLECAKRLRLLIKINYENSHTDYNFHVAFKSKKIILVKEKNMIIYSSENLIVLWQFQIICYWHAHFGFSDFLLSSVSYLCFLHG